MKAVILQSNYIPWKGYFDLINMADIFIFYDEGQYTKNDWRNRNKIKTKQGSLLLTIPLKHGNSKQKISEKRVCNNLWRNNHWKSISVAYGKAAYFKQYKEVFEVLYLDRTESSLSKINYLFINAINQLLGITTPLYTSSDFELLAGKNERIISLCQQVGATEYISGPAAKNYIDGNLFEEAKISLTWMDYCSYPTYTQLYPPFEHSVSILDLIFNQGPESINYLKSFNSERDSIQQAILYR